MPRVNTQTKSARGATRHCARCGAEIKPGERYYSWSFRYGGTRYNCGRHSPRPSELTQSLMSDVYAAQERASDSLLDAETIEDIKSFVEEVADAAREVAE